MTISFSRFALGAAVGIALASACARPARNVAESPATERSAAEIPRDAPLAVRGDARVAPGEYVRPPLGARGEDGVIVARGLKNATIDLTGVDLRGTVRGTELDKNAGFGIVLDRCENVTLRGGKLGGYKCCIVARKCTGLVIDGVELDGWYGMHLFSTTAAEDPSDWLYPHENDKDEWIESYGAAIALTDCDGATIRGSRGRHGQNGILLTRCNGCRVFDDDFSFLSGWGLALYRSSKNVVSRNVFDYCVRGYSDGAYWRGQDSAGILMFERCSDNLFVENSATHGGDGLFLFAGNDTVLGRAFERGELDAGGCDRNIWYRNDFSSAVANAIEATFSRDNWAIENRLGGSHQHGVWGGYSSRMVILRNEITGTIGGAISIEHGQECAIAENTIEKNEIGVELWWDEDKELVGGPFGKHRDTDSRDHVVLANMFAENVRDVSIQKTSGVAFASNRFPGAGDDLRIDKVDVAADADRGHAATNEDVKECLKGEGSSLPSGLVSESSLRRAHDEPDFLVKARAWKCPEVLGEHEQSASERGEKQGLDTIVVGEWGPWDFRSGEPKPISRAPGGELAAATWDARWFAWPNTVDPRADVRRWRALAESPLVQKSVKNFVDPWSADAAIKSRVGTDHFGLVATSRFTLREGGRYRARVLSDDGVRLAIDGWTVVENWTWHGPTRDEAEIDLAAGEHAIELEYFQIDGASALRVELERAR